MTNEEAKALVNRVRTKGNYVGDYYMGFTDSSVPFNQDIDILAEALEKQIPKKPIEEWSEPIFSEDKGCQFLHIMCPACKKMEVNQLDDYCPRCGQAIDWSENND